jgi:SAM-dependent methyltransferase
MSGAKDLRFEFGRNWVLFLKTVDEARIRCAEQSIQRLAGQPRLDGSAFLDIGSGSGLSSLAARRLGSNVTSFDYDGAAVACTRALRDRYFPDDPAWSVREGSVLDHGFVHGLGSFDIVYSWGVLHHTGAVWDALGNAAALVRLRGMLIVAIYNDQGRASRLWIIIKRMYNALPRALRFIILWPSAVWLWAPAMLRDLLVLRPFATWRKYHDTRGMSPWRDVVDWVGGYPFEVAKPEQIFEFCEARGFRLTRLTTCAGGHGCNEYVFVRERSA